MQDARVRLLAGAKILGVLHRQGLRCSAGWSLEGECACPVRNKFCIARGQWVKLLLDGDVANAERDFSSTGPYSLFRVMLASEFMATGLTVKTDSGVSVGPKGQTTTPVAAAVASKVGASAASALSIILTKFEGAQVIGLEGP